MRPDHRVEELTVPKCLLPTRHRSKHSIASSQLALEVRAVLISTEQMWKWRHREVKGFVCGHTAVKWERQDGNPAVRLHSLSKQPKPHSALLPLRIRDGKARPLAQVVPKLCLSFKPWGSV